MIQTIVRTAVVLLLVLAAVSCEGISKAGKDTPRLELEVAVTVADSWRGKLLGADDELVGAVRDLVLSKADVGLRFYPVRSEDYAAGSVRPPYLMTVDVRDLVVGFAHETVKREGQEPVINTSLKRLDCSVAADVTKRRDSGPDLTVGSSKDQGGAAVTKAGDGPPVAPRYRVPRDSPDKDPLPVSQADLLRAVDKALVKALSGLVEALDRELRLQGK